MNFVYPFLSPVMFALSIVIPNVISLAALFIGNCWAADSLLSNAENNVDLCYWFIISCLLSFLQAMFI